MAKLQQKTGAEDKEILPPGWTTLRPPTVAAARAMMAASASATGSPSSRGRAGTARAHPRRSAPSGRACARGGC